MATQAGIGVLIGLIIGAGITYFLMQREIRKKDNALKQCINLRNRIQEDHVQELNETLAKMEADYEQQVAAKIELYQDTHEEQLTELEAEYEARIAALTNIVPEDSDEDDEAATALDDPSDGASDGLSTETSPSTDMPASGADAPPPAVDAGFTAIPDPWTETDSQAAAQAVAETTPETPPTEASTPVSTPAAPVTEPVATTPVSTPAAPVAEPASTAASPSLSDDSGVPSKADLAQAVELGKAAAINRKEAATAIPKLGKLAKNEDVDVRLAAVTALQESGSIKAIPFLRRALRDADNRIVAAASAALSRFKGSKKKAAKPKKGLKKKRC